MALDGKGGATRGMFIRGCAGIINPGRRGSNTVAGGNDEDIVYAPVAHLSAWVSGGQLTSVRLTRMYLDRIRRHDPSLLSFATVTEALALAQAERADTLLAGGTWLGPLHGIPYAAKDIPDTAGITTGWGAEPCADAGQPG
jgi:Asp-tRNA(Asn)/Glu-tRNA(Gln) amidotransferase A subunit family amidase